MATRLTLTINVQVVKDAKKYAARKGITLSELVENYLRTLTKQKLTNIISPRVIRLRGSVNLPADFEYKKAIEKGITEKYGS